MGERVQRIRIGLYDLTLSGHSATSLQPFAGFSAFETLHSETGALIVPEFDIFYSRETANAAAGQASIAGTTSPVYGVALGRDRLSVGGGITGMMTDRFGFFIDYHAIVPIDNLLEQTISAGFSYRF